VRRVNRDSSFTAKLVSVFGPGFALYLDRVEPPERQTHPGHQQASAAIMLRFSTSTEMTTEARTHLRRACTEAEGYLELGMAQHALGSLQRWGQHVHGDARGCYLMGETLLP